MEFRETPTPVFFFILVRGSPVGNSHAVFINELLCVLSDRKFINMNAPLQAYYRHPPGMKFKGVLHFYCFTLSIIKITAPKKTDVFKTFFRIDPCPLGQDPGPQTLFMTMTYI